MSPRQLLEKLENLGVIDPKILDKIRQQVDNPDKTVKSKAILSYLVKKEQITESQAIRLLKSEPEAQTPAPSDDAEVDDLINVEKPQPDPKPEPAYDTEDLTGMANEPEPEPAPKPAPKPKASVTQPTPIDATVMDEGQFDDRADVLEVQPTRVPSARDVEPVVETILHEDVVEYDEFDEFGGDDYGQSDAKSTLGFTGKKNLKDQWATKWLYIGFGILGFLIIIGGVLAIATGGVKAEDQFKAAMDSFEKSAFQDAIGKFDQYIEDNPKHKHVPTAKARRVQSVLASSYVSKNWIDTLTGAQTLLPPLAEEEDSKIDVIRDDLAVMLPRSLFEITEKAKQAPDLAAMENELGKVLEHKKVVDNPVFIPGSQRRKPTTADNLAKIDNNIRMIQGQIDKEKEYNKSLVIIKELGEAGKTDEAFATYKTLTRNYGDLAGREELRNTMLGISIKERELVQPVESSFAVSDQPRSTPIKSTVVLATKVGDPVENLKGEIVNFLVEGSVYGIDAGTGTIVWRRFVGYETTVQPSSLDRDSLLVVNQRQHELMLLTKQTGDVQWRTEIGEPFLPPAFNDVQLVVTTVSGKIVLIDRTTGAAELGVALPQKANVSALVTDRDPYIYQVGSYSNLYVLSSQDLACREVFYLGHYDGSIAIPPQSWSGYILIAVNGGDEKCDLYVLKPEKNGLELKLVQVLTQVTNGPVSSPLTKFGRSMLITADSGEIRLLELDPSNETTPVSKYDSSIRFDNSSGQPPFVLTEGSNLWIAGKGISRFRLKRSLGQLDRDEIIDVADSFLTPLTSLDEHLLHVSRRSGSGMLSASLVDAQSLQPVWRTDFGGPLVGSPFMTGDGFVVVSNQGDVFQIDQDEIDKRYSEDSIRASTVVEDLRFESLVPLDANTFACIGPPEQGDFVYVQASTGNSKLMRLTPPADQPGCRPLSIAGDLIVASVEGQVVRINPKNGGMVGIPFQPPISPGSRTEWFEGTLIKDGVFAIATGDGATDVNDSVLYLLNAENVNSIVEINSLKSEKPFKSRLCNDGSAIYAVVGGAEFDELVSVPVAGEFAINQQIDLPGRVVGGPWKVDAGLLLMMDNDHLVLIGSDLSSQWSIPIANDQFADAPQNLGSQILLTFRSGKMMVVEPTSGEFVNQYDLGQPIIHRPTRAGQSGTLYISGLDGTVHVADLSE